MGEDKFIDEVALEYYHGRLMEVVDSKAEKSNVAELVTSTEKSFESTEGTALLTDWTKNYLPNNLINTAIENLTINRNTDGSITLNGSVTANRVYVLSHDPYTDPFINTKDLKNGTYTVCSDSSNKWYIQILGYNSNTDYSIISMSENTVTIDDSYKYNAIRLHINAGAQFSNETIYPFIIKDTDEYIWVPHEYDVTVYGKNLFNINGNINTKYDGTQAPNYNSVSDNILITTINLHAGHSAGQLIKTTIGKRYFIQANCVDVGSGSGRVSVYQKGINTAITHIIFENVGTSNKFFIADDDEYVIVFSGYQGTGAKFIDIIIAESDEPYTGSTITLNPNTPSPVLIPTYDGQTNILTDANIELIKSINKQGSAVLDSISNNYDSLYNGETLDYNTSDILGIQLDFENQTFTRLAAAQGLSQGSDFDKFRMYGARTRCNVSDDGTITAKYGDANYKEDGSNGQVMVYQPKFYYKVVPLKLEPQSKSLGENGLGYHCSKMNYYVCDTPKPGFKLHPAFINKNGEEVEYILEGAFEGCLYDISASSYITNDAAGDLTASTGDKLSSIAGVYPASGLNQNLTKPNLEVIAQNRGEDWHLETIEIVSARQLLMIIEAGNPDSQTAFGQGVTNIADNSSKNCSSKTGSTVGNKTGNANSTVDYNGTTQTANGKVSVAWRGCENPWGNIWKHILNVNLWGDGKMNGGQPYICKDLVINEQKHDDNYEGVGFTVANANGFVKAFGYGKEKYDWLMMPSKTNGDLTGSNMTGSIIKDYLWITTNLNTYKIALLGGRCDYGPRAGSFCWYLYFGAGFCDRGRGGRLVYVRGAT